MNPLDHNLHLGTRHGSWPAELDGRFGRLALTVLLRPWLERTAETLEMWARRRREREALMRLDDHVLHDVGLSRAQAEAEWRKPFWRA
jgi:uncharacterized protein YjiS (DUF1127 family)